MQTDELVRAVRLLESASRRGEIIGVALEGSTARIGRDYDGLVVLVVPGEPPRGSIAGVNLTNLQIIPGVECIVRTPEQEAHGRFTLVRCTLADAGVTELFVRVAIAVVGELTAGSEPDELGAIIARLAELFSIAQQASSLSVQGLWAELLVINDAADTRAAALHWHSDATEKFDFSSDEQRVEVKSRRGELRVHRVDLEQIRPPGAVRSWLFSFLVRPLSNGVTCVQLVDSIRDQLAGEPTARVEFDRKLLAAAGREFPRLGEIAFDIAYARAEFRVYDAEHLPCVALPLTPEVTRVNFDLDLSQQLAVGSDDLQQVGDLVNAIYPSKGAVGN